MAQYIFFLGCRDSLAGKNKVLVSLAYLPEFESLAPNIKYIPIAPALWGIGRRLNGACWLVASLQVHKETLFQIESNEARELYPPQVSLRAHKGACTNTHAYMGSMCVHSPPTLHIPR